MNFDLERFGLEIGVAGLPVKLNLSRWSAARLKLQPRRSRIDHDHQFGPVLLGGKPLALGIDGADREPIGAVTRGTVRETALLGVCLSRRQPALSLVRRDMEL